MHRAARTFRTAASRRATLGVAALALLGACGRPAAVDSGLNKDLALADQLQQRNAPALVSTQELAPADSIARAAAPRAVVHTRVVTRPAAPMTVADAAPSGTAAPRTDRHDAAAGTAGNDAGAGGGTYDPGHVVDGEVAGGDSSVATVDRASAGAAGGYEGHVPVSRQPRAHAERDGILGAVAGAVIGAAASGRGDHARGALIGAVAGGALGAVYGSSVDHTYPRYPTYSGRAYRIPAGYRTTPTDRAF